MSMTVMKMTDSDVTILSLPMMLMPDDWQRCNDFTSAREVDDSYKDNWQRCNNFISASDVDASYIDDWQRCNNFISARDVDASYIDDWQRCNDFISARDLDASFIETDSDVTISIHVVMIVMVITKW